MTPAPRPSTQRFLHFAGRLSHTLFLVLYSAAAFAGVVATPPHVTVLAGAACGAATAALAAWISWCLTDRFLGSTQLAWTALAGAGLPPAAILVSLTGAAGAALAVVLWALLLVSLANRIITAMTTPGALPERAGTGTAPAAGQVPRQTLAAIPTELLFTAWHTSGSDITGVELRERLIDELHCRDPAGVDRWLENLAAGSPEDYVRDDHNPTT